ncbi:hypothetical protein TNCV_5029261 [Trichonephila clavipes]|nr:hypothetical protein TNCV_5029261 [Trichonephila clavipes]
MMWKLEERVAAQMSSLSRDHGSKLRGLSPITHFASLSGCLSTLHSKVLRGLLATELVILNQTVTRTTLEMEFQTSTLRQREEFENWRSLF